MAPPAPDCRSQDNTRAEGMSGKLIYDQMTTGPGTGSLNAASQAAGTLTTEYSTIEGRLRAVSSSLGEGWSGASADAAQQAASPIQKAVIEMQTALKQVDSSVDNQAYQFEYNKGQLKPLPNEKPESGFWNDVAPWETDTDRAIDSYNSGESENRRIYTEYQSASGTNRNELPTEINGVAVDTLDVDVKDTSGESNSNLTTNSNGKYTSSSSSSGSNWTPGSTPNSSYVPPPPISGNGDGTTTTSGNTGGTTLPSNTFPGGPGQGGGQGGGLNNGGNTGFPGGIGVPGPGPGGAGRPGGMPGAGGRGAGGVGGMGGGRPGGGGIGAGALGAGRGAGEGFGPGGKSGVLGGMGAGEGAGRGAGGFGPGGAAAGGRGAAGGAGMGGMGGGGAKGQGDEDGEHRSAAYLVNEDNGNEIVGDMPLTAPPVLGG